MEAFNQVMMDELLELGFQLGEPPPLVEDVPGTSRRSVNGFDGDQRVDLHWDRSMEAWRLADGTTPIRNVSGVTHDYALDSRDLGEDLPLHSVWSFSATLLSLIRALEAGSYNAAPSQLAQGSGGLRVESIEATMEVVTFDGELQPQRRRRRGRGQRRRRRR